jgi:glycosyltransferase involved in cell wall biosynthesis
MVLFVSQHNLLDTTSGAAASARDLLSMLGANGFDAQFVCGSRCDGDTGRLSADANPSMKRQAASNEVPSISRHAGRHTDGVVCCVNAGQPYDALLEQYLTLVAMDHSLQKAKPDVLLTYGGGWAARAAIAASYVRRIPTIFWLRNASYHEPDIFDHVDAAITPGPYLREVYRHRFGYVSEAVQAPIDEERTRSRYREERYVTFVNPTREKGVAVFASIARVLERRRPDIRLLVVESRGTRQDCFAFGMASLQNVDYRANVSDAKDVYRDSRIVLVPSLWDEPQARVPMEAFLNGIPVIGSRRGGMVDSFAEAGFGLDLPADVSPTFSAPVPEAYVRDWVELIIRLWDSPSLRKAESERAERAAQQVNPQRLLPRYRQAFDLATTRAMRAHRRHLRDPMTLARQAVAAAIPEPVLSSAEKSLELDWNELRGQ